MVEPDRIKPGKGSKRIVFAALKLYPLPRLLQFLSFAYETGIYYSALSIIKTDIVLE